ncbi:sulfotransferase [Dyella sp. GSA-30]|nr:sulfotransferase [Dyella sp. GSA-30]
MYEQAIAAFNRRDWRNALDLTNKLLPLAPDHAALHYLNGVASLELQLLPAAVTHLGYASELEPRNGNYGAQFARSLLSLRMTKEALTTAHRTMALVPRDAQTLDTLGVVFSLCNAYQPAADAFQQVVALEPKNAQYRFNYATTLIAVGNLADAEEQLESCITINPAFWNAHLTLAQIRRQTSTHNHVARLRDLLPRTGSDLQASMHLHLALGKEYEDLADYPHAFAHFTQGKAAGGRTKSYSIARDEALFSALVEAFPNPLAETSGYDTDEPIFITGMPRSGTTVVERIISSHPDVFSAGELQNFGVVLKRSSGSQTFSLLDPDTVTRSLQLDWQQIGQRYIDSTRPLTGSKPRFIDKLPHNFLYAGFIAKALPKAKIICLRRHPMDTCLSNFRQLFTLSSPYYDYSFDLLNVGRYYVLFDRLMAHWQHVLPGRILEVEYEALVDAQEAGSREIIQFCGLSWNDACLDFHQNASPVATASAVQVREPMNRRTIDRWRNYEEQLVELHALLRGEGIAVD